MQIVTGRLSVSWPGKINENLCCGWLWHDETLRQDLSLLLFSAAENTSSVLRKRRYSQVPEKNGLLCSHLISWRMVGVTLQRQISSSMYNCHNCCNISVTILNFRVRPTFCTKLPYCFMEQFIQRKKMLRNLPKSWAKNLHCFGPVKKIAGAGALEAQLWTGSGQRFSDTAPSARYRVEKTQKMCSKLQSTGREGLRELIMTHPGPSNTKYQDVGICVETSKKGILLLTFMWEISPSSDSSINTDFFLW